MLRISENLLQSTIREQSGLRSVAYIVSQYPKISHSFIRREILSLEKQGWKITRIAMRGWDDTLVDPADLQELGRTLFVLKGGWLPLFAAMLRQLFGAPRRFASALSLALRMMRHSDRPAIWHLIYLAEACWIAPVLKQNGVQHIHAHFGTNPAEVAMLAGILSGLPYSFTIHGPEEFDKTRSIHLAEKIRRSAFTVTVSSFGSSQCFRILDAEDWHKVRVVHCGIDEAFAEIGEVTPSDSTQLVCVGRLCEQKGQIFLVEAVAGLVKEGFRFKLVMVGDGEHRPIIEGLIEAHDLSGTVELRGWATSAQVKDEILKSRAMILPSFAEGLPIVLIEAMALGRPVISTYVAGIPELVVNGECGWLFPAASKADMRDAIRTCLEASPQTLTAMGRAARARALDRHDQDREAARLAALFETAIVGQGDV